MPRVTTPPRRRAPVPKPAPGSRTRDGAAGAAPKPNGAAPPHAPSTTCATAATHTNSSAHVAPASTLASPAPNDSAGPRTWQSDDARHRAGITGRRSARAVLGRVADARNPGPASARTGRDRVEQVRSVPARRTGVAPILIRWTQARSSVRGRRPASRRPARARAAAARAAARRAGRPARARRHHAQYPARVTTASEPRRRLEARRQTSSLSGGPGPRCRRPRRRQRTRFQ